MIDLTTAVFTDRNDDDSTRETTLFFDLPADQCTKLILEDERIRTSFGNILLNDVREQGLDPLVVAPHMELQLRCKYGELFSVDGSVELGIGVSGNGLTTVCDILALVAVQDFDESAVVDLWHEGIRQSAVTRKGA